MKLKIVNRKKFIRSMIIMGSVIFLIVFIIGNKAQSHGDINYMSIYVKDGDTLWSIAETLQRENEYYNGKDIRYIINNIKNLNQLSSSSLLRGQKLLIATM